LRGGDGQNRTADTTIFRPVCLRLDDVEHMSARAIPTAEKPRAPSVRALNKQLQPAVYLLMIGLLGVLAAGSSYPPLDLNALMFLAMALLFLPILAHIVVNVRKRLAANVERLRRIYLWAGAILVAMGVVLGFNGLADRTPPRLVRTSITQKHVSKPARGRGARVLTLASWRPGRQTEEIFVSSADYHSLQVGDQVVIEVHAGLFRVPWWRRVCRDDQRYGRVCE
jgi:Lysine efflux permease